MGLGAIGPPEAPLSKNRPRDARSLTPLLSLIALSACHIPEAKEPVHAPNPLVAGEGTLSLDVPVLDQILWSRDPGDCEPWPIENRYTVHVTPKELCVEALRHELVTTEKQELNNQANVLLTTEEGPIAHVRLVMSRDPERVGACKGLFNGDVWQVTLAACVSNDAHVTKSTRELSIKPGAVDQAIWKLDGKAAK